MHFVSVTSEFACKRELICIASLSHSLSQEKSASMLVLPPTLDFSSAQIARALLAILLTAIAVPFVNMVRRKVRIARGIASIPGPKGVPLLGALPELATNLKHIYTYQVPTCFQLLCVAPVWPRAN